MFTVEMEPDAEIIVTLDESDSCNDVEVCICNDGTVFMRQYDDTTEQHQMLYMSVQQFKDILSAWDSPEGAYYLMDEGTQ